MKITGIDIGEYRQFKNIKFDFTYPEGHPKAGQPLEKVCFIGQSGTGKTTLLRVILDFIDLLTESSSLFPHLSTTNWVQRGLVDECSVNFKIEEVDYKYTQLADLILDDEDPLIQHMLSSISSLKKMLMYIPDNILEIVSLYIYQTYEEFEQGGVIANGRLRSKFSEKDSENVMSFFKQEKIIDFRRFPSSTIRYSYFDDIIKFDNDLKNAALSIINNSGNLSADRLMGSFIKWKAENLNPRVKYAQECLDKFLSNFRLKVDVDTADAPLVIKTNTDTAIDSAWLSTGAKQIIATALALYKFESNNTIILFDEPERSLFPDIQRELIKYYIGLAPEAQFFFATHSPIIASAFEPCERFILYFDENGEVKCRNGVAPEGDDPNDVLRQDFDMAELMLQKGLEQYEKYRQLAMQIRVETDEVKKNKLIAERARLGDLYNF